jgi:hypothetical protein
LRTIFSLILPVSAEAVSINERAGNNFRTASNNQEHILNKSNVNAEKFVLLHTFDFDTKVETQPLVVEKGAGGDHLIIVTTMKNEVYGINARTKVLSQIFLKPLSVVVLLLNEPLYIVFNGIFATEPL